MSDMIDVFTGLCKAADSDAQIAIVRAEAEEAILVMVPSEKLRHLLAVNRKKAESLFVYLVSAPNIVLCNGLWWFPYPDLIASESIDAIGVFYGPAISRGSLWHESSGNPSKCDYRRLAWAHEAERAGKHPNVYREPIYPMSEGNVGRLLKGVPLLVGA